MSIKTENTTYKISDYDFVEFGSSRGRSLAFAMDILGGKRGIGIDINPKKVHSTREAGFDCMQADVTTLNLPDKSVRFVVMSHFLEHLPNLGIVELCIQSAARVASDFLFIRGPCFDADEYLNNLGLKYYYADWKGHPCHLTSGALCHILRKNKLTPFDLSFKGLTKTSSDGYIHPHDSPANQNKYNPEIHPPKVELKFTQNVYKEIICLVRLRELQNWDELAQVVRGPVTL